MTRKLRREWIALVAAALAAGPAVAAPSLDAVITNARRKAARRMASPARRAIAAGDRTAGRTLVARILELDPEHAWARKQLGAGKRARTEGGQPLPEAFARELAGIERWNLERPPGAGRDARGAGPARQLAPPAARGAPSA